MASVHQALMTTVWLHWSIQAPPNYQLMTPLLVPAMRCLKGPGGRLLLLLMLAALFTYPPTIVVAFVATGSVVCEASLQACRCNTLDRRHVLLIMLCFLALLAAPSLQHCGM